MCGWFNDTPLYRCRRRLLPVVLCAALFSTPVAAIKVEEYPLTRAEWPRHANARKILALPAVSESLQRFTENDRMTITIRHPGDDSGRRWARELYNWLVSLGVPIRYIELQPGSGGVNRLMVGVIDRE